MAANKFQLSTVMELGKCDSAEAENLVNIIENEALVESWQNGTNADFRRAIRYARMYINNGNSWE